MGEKSKIDIFLIFFYFSNRVFLILLFYSQSPSSYHNIPLNRHKIVPNWMSCVFTSYHNLFTIILSSSYLITSLPGYLVTSSYNLIYSPYLGTSFPSRYLDHYHLILFYVPSCYLLLNIFYKIS